ncbi:nucleoside recognition domain-containing protein [Paenibacillus whitsoniae]|uniref:Ferrous iron transporter B n=1 Tax=Paenibacillus whitsoniae TaxID=2496558 RepID=A0A3S0A6W0_9BACL|nr:nucleoside recognition domain-containing protein [Paenibacillus whitsoniae]RTE11015.1 ferrous iron transporter B [Paenibacillus whitsoniae]
MLNQAEAKVERGNVVLVGFESSGKSALFRGLTGYDTGEESNFRGSTIFARRGTWTSEYDVVDLPGIRLRDDSQTTQLALAEILESDAIILVVRGTHAQVELPLLLETVNFDRKRVMLLLTFEDKATHGLQMVADSYSERLGIPVMIADTRNLPPIRKGMLLRAFEQAKPIVRKPVLLETPDLLASKPQQTWFEHPIWGRPLAILTTLLVFAVPVMLAFLLSQWLQPIVDNNLIEPIKELLVNTPAMLQTMLIGNYGMITLGWYSFLWAFPVVLLLGISIASLEESGVKDRITDALDGWLRYVGLTGRDLVPVLSGYGCNVVAVFQSRVCSACTRKSCVSLITFGSACSYQIGASLSIFGTAGHAGLFVPYLFLLFVIGAVHTRIWNRKQGPLPTPLYTNKTFLQKPSIRAIFWRVRAVTKQFLFQAMPIFLLICLVSTLLELTGTMQQLTAWAGPVLHIFHLPAEAAGGIIFSILRKDGLLTLNQDEGAFLQSLDADQIFVLVYLASTLTACLVTLWTVRKELGWRFASSLAGKQVLTSALSALCLAWLI